MRQQLDAMSPTQRAATEESMAAEVKRKEQQQALDGTRIVGGMPA